MMDDANASGIVSPPHGGHVAASGFWDALDDPPSPPPRASDASGRRGAATSVRRPVVAGFGRRLPRFRLRFALPLVAFALGLVGFAAGVGVSQRPEVMDAAWLAKIYYALGLFIFGGMDLGTPIGGPGWARTMLWTAYFLAPAITASAVIEAALRVFAPDTWKLRRVRGHIIVAGGGRLTALYLQRLRELDPNVPVVVVMPPSEAGEIDSLEFDFGARVIEADPTSEAVLAALRLDRAHRVLLLTDDDFINLDAATKILAMPDPPQVVVHVADLRFLRSMAGTRLARRCETFNGHQIAASHLVQTRVLDHFRRTQPRDLVIMAGFGRFGETILGELQARAAGGFDHVVIIDMDAERRAMVFDEQIGFSKDYRLDIVPGDLRDPRLWQQLAGRVELVESEPVFVVGSGVDRTNLRTALWLASKYPRGFVLARSEGKWSFAEEVSHEAGIHTFSVAELVAQSMPLAWFQSKPGGRSPATPDPRTE
jgi:Trk K+ transport system NAD-binding subunit